MGDFSGTEQRANLDQLVNDAFVCLEYILSGKELHVFEEPAAIVDRVVFGCYDPKGGTAGSLYDISNDPRLNHRVTLTPGIREEECSGILSGFFAELRKRKKEQKQERRKGIEENP